MYGKKRQPSQVQLKTIFHNHYTTQISKPIGITTLNTNFKYFTFGNTEFRINQKNIEMVKIAREKNQHQNEPRREFHLH